MKKIMGKTKYNQCHHMQSIRDKVQFMETKTNLIEKPTTENKVGGWPQGLVATIGEWP